MLRLAVALVALDCLTPLLVDDEEDEEEEDRAHSPHGHLWS